MFWFVDGVVIFILQWKPNQAGKITHACIGKQRGKIKLS